ncbi:hypothetical protein GGR28_002752 [Lewinella aquimaris]|uniref:Uncharacterized protein n=1 Tax=Neolewinella aquimaris TaxID=1835722 RepID=A0A840E8S7_9BACT|nr:hypothetical protein [Neolewinella aquimaris]MBB4080122.1 hypothetical protein [Neolewinella aquimaris]
MPYLLFILLLLGACSSPEEVGEMLEQEESTLPTTVFGYRGGWGSENYIRYHDGNLYRNAYAGLRTNEPDNRLNRDDLATDENNWNVVGPAPQDVIEAVRALPMGGLVEIEKTEDCPALAADGGCPYVGVVRGGEGGGYLDWYGDFPDRPAVAQYMQRVSDLVEKYGQ